MDLVDDLDPMVDKATSILYYRSALEYIDLRRKLGVTAPSLDEALLEMKRRFPDNKTHERYQVLHKTAGRPAQDLCGDRLLPFRKI